jgi:hypothetical protein
MKIIAFELGQVLYLISTDEVRPLSGVYPPDLVRQIVERYLFMVFPTDLIEASKSGFKFAMGTFTNGDKTIPIQKFEAYSDGIVVATCHTDDSIALLNDVVPWLISEFGYRTPMTVKLRYTSNVIVDFEKSLERLITPFSLMSKEYARYLKEYAAIDAEIDVVRIGLGADPVGFPPFVNTNFLLDRRVDTPYTQNRYFCSAPLPTQAHVDFLQSMESQL